MINYIKFKKITHPPIRAFCRSESHQTAQRHEAIETHSFNRYVFYLERFQQTSQNHLTRVGLVYNRYLICFPAHIHTRTYSGGSGVPNQSRCEKKMHTLFQMIFVILFCRVLFAGAHQRMSKMVVLVMMMIMPPSTTNIKTIPK